MAIVLRGLGLGIDSGSTIVAFGIARDLDEGETVEDAVRNASIENVFVIDFGMGRRKPTKAEFRRFKRISALISTRGLQFTERKSRNGQLEFDVSLAPKLGKKLQAMVA